MIIKKRHQKQKKLKTRYYYVDNQNEIYGTTDNCCRTMINLFTVFKKNYGRKVFFDIDRSKKIYFNKEMSLSLIESNNKKKYKYQNRTIKREYFILLLGCEEK